MNTIVSVEKVIKKIPGGKFFLWTQFIRNIQSSVYNVFLVRLAKSNEVSTICRGIYFRTEKSRYLPGRPIPPSTDKIIKAVSKKTGETITVHLAVALNQLGLSTQIPVPAIYYVRARVQ